MAVAYLALVVVGVGNAIEDVGLFTLPARSASPRGGGRVLGATEFVVQAGLGAGSVAAPLPCTPSVSPERWPRWAAVAITGNSVSNAAADALVTQRLTADSLTDPDTNGTR